ncbi:MAG: type II methionyl aminopeptidase [Aciduliprofundum sp.]|nr:MAG: type II methionyl aminopeptidase [Aciduliprofundum sp.]
MISDNELEKYLKAGSIAADAIQFGKNLINEGVSLEEVAEETEAHILKNGAKLAFPVNLSINEEAAHYTPSRNDRRKFSRNDIVKLDLGAHLDGYIADTAITVEVGRDTLSTLSMSSERALLNVTQRIRPGIRISEIGKIIEETIKSYGFRPIYNLTGHQLSRNVLHAGMSIPNYDDGSIIEIEAGMAFAIEPFSTDGVGYVKEGSFGNIMQIVRDPEEMGEIYENYGTLPFSTRWIYRDFSNPERVLDLLLRTNKVYKFPVLKERKKGKVAQFEHTFVITGERIYITTLRKV